MAEEISWFTHYGYNQYTFKAPVDKGLIQVFDGRLMFLCGIHTLKQVFTKDDEMWTVSGADNMGMSIVAVIMTKHTPRPVVELIWRMYTAHINFQMDSLNYMLSTSK
jgi:hypothetical protein